MQQAARLLQERLAQATIGTFELGEGLGDIHYTGASVGVAAVTPEGISAEDALKLADREMYKAKAKRRKRGG
ncbi:diguanylate cyclase domain-containing protein [Metapseudomonas otitidis]|uniref:diguanylate cyclase domain-containing protein n=1 Tax=Metapseudomonas otitidis TaxID=319939 RepID=UPI003A8B1B09